MRSTPILAALTGTAAVHAFGPPGWVSEASWPSHPWPSHPYPSAASYSHPSPSSYTGSASSVDFATYTSAPTASVAASAACSAASGAASTTSSISPASTDVPLFTDLDVISRLWGFISTYADNPENYFGVNDTGLPSGCQVEQVHLLQRHAQRFQTSGDDDGTNNNRFAAKVANFTAANPDAVFGGPLAFLSSWEYFVGKSLLTNVGAATEVTAGVTFWNRYGRILYDATVGQLAYNSSAGLPIPTLRTTSQSRIENSAINWAIGFFGTSFQTVPDETLEGFSDDFNLVIIPEGGTENDTLAAYDSCFNDNLEAVGYIGDDLLFNLVPTALADATTRMNAYAPEGFTFTTNDTFAMQSICAYETGYLGPGMSAFCTLFTLDEWNAFEQALNIEYFYDYSFGNPTGRAQGIGYVQELLARIQNQYIFSSNSSVNSTIDNNADTFPLGQPFYADFSHDDIIISALTAMSLEYLDDAPNYTEYPVNFGNFQLSHLTPFGGRLVTEVIGCAAADPTPVASRLQYYATQYGYNAANATNKFIRMRVNNGILPIDTITGGACANGRPDGLCELSSFIASQADSYALSNYNYACFANYTLTEPAGFNYNGAVTAATSTDNE